MTLPEFSVQSVAVLSRSFSRHAVLRGELQAIYPNAVFNDTGRTLAGRELIDFLAPHDAAIVALERIDDDVLASLPGLRVISKYGVGLDNLDLAAAARRGVRIGWTGGVNRRSVSELAISFMIAGLRGVIHSHAEIPRGVWRQYVGRQLSDATVGLIGFGAVGQDLAMLLRAFGARVLAHDIRDLSQAARALDVTLCGLDELLAESDVVTLHVPLTRLTAGMMSPKRIAAMRQGAVLVNTARGGLIDEDALRLALLDGKLSAACLDVFDIEPPTHSPLFQTPGFLGASHIGGSAREAQLAMGRSAIAGLGGATDPLSFIPEWPL
jgi:D-3-phosphoglycerate dehydrogenase